VASRGVTIGSQAHRGAVLDETSEGGQQSSSLLGAAAKRLSSNCIMPRTRLCRVEE
jgi:hypothetical protein